MILKIDFYFYIYIYTKIICCYYQKKKKKEGFCFKFYYFFISSKISNMRPQPIVSISTSCKRRKWLLDVPFSFFSVVIITYHFEIIQNLINPSEINITLFSVACFILFLDSCLYFWLYFFYVIHPKPSQKITSSRWIFVSPFQTWLILDLYLISALIFIISLWREYNIFSIAIVFAYFFFFFILLSPQEIYNQQTKNSLFVGEKAHKD